MRDKKPTDLAMSNDLGQLLAEKLGFSLEEIHSIDIKMVAREPVIITIKRFTTIKDALEVAKMVEQYNLTKAAEDQVIKAVEV